MTLKKGAYRQWEDAAGCLRLRCRKCVYTRYTRTKNTVKAIWMGAAGKDSKVVLMLRCLPFRLKKARFRPTLAYRMYGAAEK